MSGDWSSDVCSSDLYAVELAQQTQVANKQFAAFLGSAELAAGVVADLTSFSAKKFLFYCRLQLFNSYET